MNFLRKLERNLLTSIVVSIVSLLGFICSCFLVNSDYKDIPLGFLLSGAIVAGLYLLTHFLTKKDSERDSSTRSIISVIVRFVILVGSMILLGLAYYRWDFKYFNLFVFIGVYTAGVIFFVTSHIFIKERKE
ncbi:MAG: hypothetical protein J5955_05530 [Bacilli bacterium]|nr:hypothetical protein [Bacilli bacterium]